ncbi:MAG: hypothetical protein AB7H80_01870 [Candidatus Kapaibacterium sp.]
MKQFLPVVASIVILFTLLFSGSLVFAQPITDSQGDVGIGTVSPHESALLDLTSTTRGLLIPRMTVVQRDAIVRPSPGLLI